MTGSFDSSENFTVEDSNCLWDSINSVDNVITGFESSPESRANKVSDSNDQWLNGIVFNVKEEEYSEIFNVDQYMSNPPQPLLENLDSEYDADPIKEYNEEITVVAGAEYASTVLPSVLGRPENCSNEESLTSTTSCSHSSSRSKKKVGKVIKLKKSKVSHNMVEKKYRTNINSKILALRDAVPSLRIAAHGLTDDSLADLDGLTPASKLNKASVLLKATEYIKHLEKKNRKLAQENSNLKSAFATLRSKNIKESVNISSSNKDGTTQTNIQRANTDQQQQNESTNVVHQQNSRSTGSSMRLAISGLSLMAGISMLENDDSNSKELNGLPMQLFKMTRYLVVFYAFLVILEPYIYAFVNTRTKLKEGRQKSWAKSSHVSAFVRNLLKAMSSNCLKVEKLGKEESLEKLCSNINQMFLSPNYKEKSIFELLSLYVELSNYEISTNYRLAAMKCVIASVLRSYSSTLKLFVKIPDLKKIRGQEIIDIEGLEHCLDSEDLVQRLSNIYFYGPSKVNYAVKVGKYETSYNEILKDVTVNNDLIKIARNLKANEVLRQLMIFALMNATKPKKKDVSRKILNKLNKLERLSVPGSHTNSRIRLFMSLVNSLKTFVPSKIEKTMVPSTVTSNQYSGTEEKVLDEIVDAVFYNYTPECECLSKNDYVESTEVMQKAELKTVAKGRKQTKMLFDFDTRAEEEEYECVSYNEYVRPHANLTNKRKRCKIINGEEFIALTCFLILKYSGDTKHSAKLMSHLLNHRDLVFLKSKSQVSLMSFTSIMLVLIKLDEGIRCPHNETALSRENLSKTEDLISCLRYWIGTESDVTRNINEIDSSIKLDICDKLVSLVVRYSGIEVN